MSEPSAEPAARLTNHAFPLDHFDALAGGMGGPAAVRLLLAGEYSRRLLLLRALLDRLTDRPELLGPLPPAEAAWDTLIEIQAQAPNALTHVLLQPQVGTWISHALRQSKNILVATATDWADVGQIHAVILAAAIRAGMPLRTKVPVRHGGVLLPTLGLARFPSVTGFAVATADSADRADATCLLRVVDQEVPVPAQPEKDGPNWWGLRSLRCGSGARTLTISLDDIDPYRNLAEPVEPCRLDEGGVDSWRRMLDGAWEVLARWHPTTADAMAVGLISISPLADDASWTVRSASTGDGFGGAITSLPPDPITLAMTLVHEFQHIKLGGLLHLATLHRDDEGERLYAPWRPDPRPLAGLLQGVYAFFGITEFWRTQRHVGAEADRTTADFEFAYARRQTWTGLRTLARSHLLTELGARLAQGLTNRLRRWLTEPIRVQSARAAWAAASDHLAGWRIRNIPAELRWVADGAAAWRQGREPPAIDPAQPGTTADGPPWTHGRLTLYRAWRAAARCGVDGSAGRLPDPRPVPGVTHADTALLDGDSTAAAEEYLRRIARDHADLDAWTGLGLALAADGGNSAWRPLLRTPELVHALYRELATDPAPPSALDLAGWLSRGHFSQRRPPRL